MAVISPSPISVAIQQALRVSIAESAAKGSISLTEELMGYTLAGFATAEVYDPPTFGPPARRISVPEVLTGGITNKSS